MIDYYTHLQELNKYIDFLENKQSKQFSLQGVVASKLFTKTDLSRAYQVGCLENVDEYIKYSFKDFKELQQDSLEWVKRYTK